MPVDPAKHWWSGFAPRGREIIVSGILFTALSACAMPRLEDGANLLTMPPGGAERATTEPATALQPSATPLAQQENPFPADTEADTSPPPQAGLAGDEFVQPIPADGVMRGEFEGASLAFADADGLVCAGRLVGNIHELSRGISIPVNCSDGSDGKVKIVELTSSDQARGLVQIGKMTTTPVWLTRSTSIE